MESEYMIDWDGMWDLLNRLFFALSSPLYYLFRTDAFSFLLHSESIQWSDVDHSLLYFFFFTLLSYYEISRLLYQDHRLITILFFT